MSHRAPSRARFPSTSEGAQCGGAVQTSRSPTAPEVLMAGVNLWKAGSGSKRRVERIRWKRSEIVQASILFLLMTAFGLWVGIWIATHHVG
jgi:hypothetical protein